MDFRAFLSNRILMGKTTRSMAAIVVIIVVYIILFGTNAADYTFLIAGGVIGFLAASRVLVAVIFGKSKQRLEGSYATILFWRTICDIGLALRFVATPWFDMALCNNISCDRKSSDQSLCSFPSVLVEFFWISSEAWFFCSGVDLYVTITNPFSSFKNRLFYYHIFCWGVSCIMTLSPFLSSNVSDIYGFWHFDGSRDDIAICFINAHSLQSPAWGMVIVPTMMVYIACFNFLYLAYKRLKSGLTKTFLPRMKILIINSVILVVFMAYWTLLLLFYLFAFGLETYHAGFNRLVLFMVPIKGVAVLFLLIIIDDFNVQLREKDENMSGNVALRQEVLMFATVGIRNSAQDAHKADPEKTAIRRRPQKVTSSSPNAANELVTPLFFVRLVFGFSAEIKAVQNTVQSNIIRKPTLPIDARQSTSSATGFPLTGESNFCEVNPINSISLMVGSARRGNNVAVDEASAGKATKESDIGELRASMKASKIKQGSVTDTLRGTDLLVVRDTHLYMDNYEITADPLTIWDVWQQLVNRQSDWVEFTEFAPYYFRQIRYASNITDESYIHYFSKTMKERLSEGGASGALFFFSRDELFIAKSCKYEELVTITSNAKKYCEYLCANKNSYISKVLGAYRLQIYGNDLCFFVMSNIYKNPENLSMHEKYDIKGSWLNRNSKPPRDGQSVTCMHCEQKFTYEKQRARTLRAYLGKLLSNEHSSSAAHRSLARSHGNKSGLLALEIQDEVILCSQGLDLKNNPSKMDAENNDDLLCPYTVNGIHEPSVVLKDNDLKYKIRLSAETARDL
eukprot:gene23930-31058_t